MLHKTLITLTTITALGAGSTAMAMHGIDTYSSPGLSALAPVAGSRCQRDGVGTECGFAIEHGPLWLRDHAAVVKRSSYFDSNQRTESREFFIVEPSAIPDREGD
jgi:hypothetical protein